MTRSTPWLPLLVLTLLWAAITESASSANLLLGLAVAGLTLFVLRHHLSSMPLRRPVKTLRLLGLFLVELAKSGWRVAVVVSRPKLDIKPGLMLYRTDLKSDFEISLLANLITLTPGTLTVDVMPDRQTLIVHALDCGDPDQTRREIRDGFECAIREACA